MCFLAVIHAACGCSYRSAQPFCPCSTLVSDPVYHHSTTMCPRCTRRELDNQAREEAGISDDESDYEDFLDATHDAFDDSLDVDSSFGRAEVGESEAAAGPAAQGDRSKPWESTNVATEMSTAGTQLYGAEPLPELDEDSETQWVYV